MKITSLCLAASLALGGPALAAEEFQLAKPQVAGNDAATPAKQSEKDLERLSGGASPAVSLTEQDLTALNTGNSYAAGVIGSGAISVQDNAFNGFAGVGNVIMNTGHNNNLQSTLSVTIIVTQ